MKFIPYLTIALLIAAGCTKTVEKEVTKTNFEHTQLVATVMPVGDSGVSGSVTFTKATNAVSIEGQFEGLEPGKHGFHIHQYGDCRAEDATSAGGHFNPDGHDHAGPEDEMRHMGDLGNIEADENGSASINATDTVIDLQQILGRGLVIHSGEDDLTSQPTGAAGSRVACGVIGIAQK